MNRNQRGFSIFELSIILFIVGVLTLAGYLVYTKNKTDKSKVVAVSAVATSKVSTKQSLSVSTVSDIDKIISSLNKNASDDTKQSASDIHIIDKNAK